MDILDQSIGKLARSTPGVTAVFHKYQLDFCCGGNQTVRAAARNKTSMSALCLMSLPRLTRRTPRRIALTLPTNS